MRYDIAFRINVTKPLGGVAMRVQRGRDELLEPVSSSADALVFDLEITADISGATPNFLGKYAQGPKAARFIYVNSGSYAGQHGTCWDRRAKLSLMDISKEQIDNVLAQPGSRLETTIRGVGKDGGPTCASVKYIVWEVKK
jgi:hypothetical protein